jgi:NAD(P)-dependent dehydrogenase (short-subunit alcohol dehydrogenase family)
MSISRDTHSDRVSARIMQQTCRMAELQDKVALITGASSGIGRGAALRLAQEGAKVGVLARREEELEELVEKISRAGGEALALDADVSSYEELQQAVKQLVTRWDRLDIVFANAGTNGVWAPIDKLTPEDWQTTLAVNLSGTFYTIKCCFETLRKQGGSVIVTSSVNGTRMFSNSGASAYATSKAGQVALTQMLALEFASHRIRVNVICPGMIETPIHEKTEKRDLKRAQEPVEFPQGSIPLTDGEPGTADQVADLVLFLASDRSSHITGTPIWIDGGQSLLQG